MIAGVDEWHVRQNQTCEVFLGVAKKFLSRLHDKPPIHPARKTQVFVKWMEQAKVSGIDSLVAQTKRAKIDEGDSATLLACSWFGGVLQKLVSTHDRCGDKSTLRISQE